MERSCAVARGEDTNANSAAYYTAKYCIGQMRGKHCPQVVTKAVSLAPLMRGHRGMCHFPLPENSIFRLPGSDF